MIVVFGSINMDLVARVASIPRPGETVLSAGYEVMFGGKGANQAVAAARASRGTGIAVAMAARVGDDAFGRSALANLRENGVSIEHVSTGPEPTGCAFIVVETGGENAITVASGANGALEAAAAPRSFAAGDILVLQMEVPFGAALEVARRAQAGGARVVWNFAPAPAGFGADRLRDLLDATDVLVVNALEAVAASLLLSEDSHDPSSAAAAIARAARPVVVLTEGARGATAFGPHGVLVHAVAPAIEPRDTTGAGDTFVGVLAAGMAEHLDLARALPRACRAASLACLTAGAQAGMPDRAALDAPPPGQSPDAQSRAQVSPPPCGEG